MKPNVRLASCAVLSWSVLGVAAACTSGELGNAELFPGGGAPTLQGIAGSSAVSSAGAVPARSSAGSSAGSGLDSGAGAGGASSAGSANTSGGGPGSAGAMAMSGAPSTVCSDAPPNNGDTCAHAVQYGWCSQSWLGSSCQQSCGKCSNGAGGASSGAGGGAGTVSGGGAGSVSGGGAPGSGGQPPVLSGGTNGWATRYWDCCKPACGWKANVPSGSNPVASCSVSNQSFGSNYDQASACPNGSNGPAFMCQNFGPWAVSSNLAYGFAAVSKGGDYCGRCYQLQFTGTSHNSSNDTGSQSLSGKTMIVQAINTGGIDGNQFDLLIPGGGVGDFNACATQWGTASLGEQYGGFFLACQKANGYDYTKSKACAAAKCESVFSNKPDLLASCNWFVTWFGAPDNPALMYKEVSCPAAITAVSGLHR